jgi:diaminopimelate epimerase
MGERAFVKMHGLGNDFVVLDARDEPLSLAARDVQALADRRTGIGCDQVIVIAPARTPDAHARMRIWNADGGEVAACGNASRCVAALLSTPSHGRGPLRIETAAGVIDCSVAADATITVDMGAARLAWQEIPLAQAIDTLHLPLAVGPLADPVAVGMGNPHAVFFVADAAAVPLADVGPLIERHPLFPERTNVEIAEVQGSDRIRLRVWERGSGLTRACGTGACAAVVAAHRRGLCGRSVEVVLDGGRLAITWRESDGHVLMTGPATHAFTGVVDPARLANGGGGR